MNTIYRSAGLISAAEAAAIQANAIAKLGPAHHQVVIRTDGTSVELVRRPAGDYQLRVEA